LRCEICANTSPKGRERIEATDTDGTLLTVYNYE
jgi:hypothetical protein